VIGRLGRESRLKSVAGRRLYVRYANRRIYDTVSARYVSLWDVVEHWMDSPIVFDHVTGKDITKYTLACARHEEESRRLRSWRKKLGVK
jgi:polyhydroxyalkanoate synthesis regulator protein